MLPPPSPSNKAVVAAATYEEHKTFQSLPKSWLLLSVRTWLTDLTGRQAAEAARHLQHQIRKQGDRWVRFQAYSSTDLLYQSVRLWLEYQSARKQKSFLRLVRDRLDLVFQRLREIDVVWARFETERASNGEELGKEPGESFNDWYILSNLRDVFLKLA